MKTTQHTPKKLRMDWLAYKMRTGLGLEEMDIIAKQVGIDMNAPFVTEDQARAFNQACDLTELK